MFLCELGIAAMLGQTSQRGTASFSLDYSPQWVIIGVIITWPKSDDP